jgi:hypothetical protein
LGNLLQRKKLCIILTKKTVWATFWAIFFTNSSGPLEARLVKSLLGNKENSLEKKNSFSRAAAAAKKMGKKALESNVGYTNLLCDLNSSFYSRIAALIIIITQVKNAFSSRRFFRGEMIGWKLLPVGHVFVASIFNTSIDDENNRNHLA